MKRAVKFLLLLGIVSAARVPFVFLRNPREAIWGVRLGLRLARVIVRVFENAKVELH
jgi:hypothetical protein